MKRCINYKMVKDLMPHCNICKEKLQGVGSIVQPYKCSCGTWEYKHHPDREWVIFLLIYLVYNKITVYLQLYLKLY